MFRSGQMQQYCEHLHHKVMLGMVVLDGALQAISRDRPVCLGIHILEILNPSSFGSCCVSPPTPRQSLT